MQCPVCSHQNEGGNFCEQCGTKLEPIASQESAPAAEQGMNQPPVFNKQPNYQQNNYQQDNYQQGGYQQGGYAQSGYKQGYPQGNQQPNQYLEGAKKISQMYFGYFIGVLKKPYASSKSVGEEHFLNAIITIVLYSFIIPLMSYFGIKSFTDTLSGGFYEADIDLPFTEIVIYPTIAYAVFILLVATFTFAAVKMGRVDDSYKAVISRFGSFMIPFLAILLIGLVLAILKAKIFIIFLVLGFTTSLFIVPPLVIASFKKETQEGLDVIYGTLITYILTFVTIVLMSAMLVDRIISDIIKDASYFF